MYGLDCLELVGYLLILMLCSNISQPFCACVHALTTFFKGMSTPYSLCPSDYFSSILRFNVQPLPNFNLKMHTQSVDNHVCSIHMYVSKCRMILSSLDIAIVPPWSAQLQWDLSNSNTLGSRGVQISESSVY